MYQGSHCKVCEDSEDKMNNSKGRKGRKKKKRGNSFTMGSNVWHLVQCKKNLGRLGLGLPPPIRVSSELRRHVFEYCSFNRQELMLLLSQGKCALGRVQISDLYFQKYT